MLSAHSFVRRRGGGRAALFIEHLNVVFSEEIHVLGRGLHISDDRGYFLKGAIAD